MSDGDDFGYTSADDQEFRDLIAEVESTGTEQNNSSSTLQQVQGQFAQSSDNSFMLGGVIRGGSARQITLFGRTVADASVSVRSPYINRPTRAFVPLWEAQPHRSNHTLVNEKLKTFIYPSNVPVREYQRVIAERALLSNVLCSLPTGLGKTLIAAVVMLNWYRWTTDSKIVFVAPTRPLVAQQAEACFKMVGIPREDTAMLVGSSAGPSARDIEWATKRVFFMTPQTFDNDLKRGAVDPKKIVCFVVDEAHRATGEYSYVQIVRFLKRFTNQCRILALSATPGSSVEAVQGVITNLSISHAEIRTEESDDVKEYVRGTEVEHVSVGMSKEGNELLGLLGNVIQPFLTDLNKLGAVYVQDPLKLTLFGLVQARIEYRKSAAISHGNNFLKFKAEALFGLLTPLGHSLSLLKNHGIKPFWDSLQQIELGHTVSPTGKKKKPGKNAERLLNSEYYMMLKKRTAEILASEEFVTHEKVNLLVAILVSYFTDPNVLQADSKVIIFCEYRSSANEIQRVLESVDDVKSHVFFGQAAAKDVEGGGSGMSQKEQHQIIADFRSGIYNTIIATSIGEEGLDIGQVDMIICYDASASPVRVLQRMGRTGRFRKGRIVALLMDSERQKWNQAMVKYKEIQDAISTQTHFEFIPCARIIPDHIIPEIELKTIEIPPNNKIPPEEITNKKARGRKKASEKKFNIPDNVNTSFTTASSLILEEDRLMKRGIKKSKNDQENHDNLTIGQLNKRRKLSKAVEVESQTIGKKDISGASHYGFLSPRSEEKVKTRYFSTLAKQARLEIEYDPIKSINSGNFVDGKFDHSKRSLGLREFVNKINEEIIPPIFRNRTVEDRWPMESIIAEDDDIRDLEDILDIEKSIANDSGVTSSQYSVLSDEEIIEATLTDVFNYKRY
ncbi:P-loop containing nucleoside triphosphate hydrolase protein [Lipomyces japonicus]|uniref:P-loop containing nucleoside triphosphate hydrolase protein n=1 Tax=Lipomyces japonicus TaxID=56871 RepID=UPI0034CFE890